MTVSGTDDPGQRHVSQIATSSTTQHDECPVTTSNQHITYTTAQLHEINRRTREDMLACLLGALSVDDVMSRDEITTLYLKLSFLLRPQKS